MSADRQTQLLAWQWEGYPDFHGNKRNLMIHAITNPLFLFGVLSIVTCPFTRWHCAVGGALLIVAAIVIQGRGHKLEKNAPIPFLSPFEGVRRLFLENLVNFPRYVLTGGFSRAWKAANG
jgi:hypothetical protein